MGIIRIFLALSVVAFHLHNNQFQLMSGVTAVYLFFIASGFYMALILNEKYADNREFYLGRMARLLPPYYLMILVMVVWFAFNGAPTVLTSNTGLPLSQQALLIFLNLSLLGQDLFQMMVDAYYGNLNNAATRYVAEFYTRDFFQTDWMLIGHAWSLSSELLFYICAPFIVRSPRRIAVVLLLSFCLRMAMIYGLGVSSAVWGGRFFPMTLCVFLLGAGAYHIGKALEGRLPLRRAGIGFMAFFVGFSLWSLYAEGRILYTSDYDTLGFWVVYLVFAAALPCVFALSRNWRWDRLIGDLSYPVYLVHGLVIGLTYSLAGPFLNETAKPVAALLLSLGCGFLIHRLVETPSVSAAQGAAKAGWGFGRTAGALALGIGLIMTFSLLATRRDDQNWVRHNPRFLEAGSSYNILGYGPRFLAQPHGMAVDWSRDDVPGLPGVIFGDTLDVVREDVAKFEPLLVNPRLVQVVGAYNIISFRGKYFAIPHGVAVDWSKDDVSVLSGVVFGDTLDVVREGVAKLAPHLSNPQLLQVAGAYNIVAFRDKYFAVPHGVAVDWFKDDVPGLPGVVVGDTLDVVRERVATLQP